MSTQAKEQAILDFDPFEGDFGEPGDSILANKMVTARKPGPCSHCKQKIQKGERVRSMAAKFGNFMRYRWCAACCDAMVAADDDSDDSADPWEAWEARAALRNDQRAQQREGQPAQAQPQKDSK